MLPEVISQIPGPRSLLLGESLERYESRNVTFISDEFPIFWDKAEGSNVWDVDGNRFIDLTSAFAVSSLGHRNPRLINALTEQANKLLHGMGDVHPTELKVELCKKISEITFERWTGEIGKSILSSSGSESIESALKTAFLATGKEGIICFEGGYHGTSIGSLSVAGIPRFRKPFTDQIAENGHIVPYGTTGLDELLSIVNSINIGAIIVEPILGRGGKVVPDDNFLPSLRKICDDNNIILIMDEIYTGFNRTGELFASDHWKVVPDIICLGKALTGGFPLSVCAAKSEIMDCWPKSDGEAIHTSTFLGNPLGCAMALESISIHQNTEIRNQVNEKGLLIRKSLEGLSHRSVGRVRGLGLMLGLEIVDESGNPNGPLATTIIKDSLKSGIITLADGPDGHVLAIAPTFCISEEEIVWFINWLEDRLKLSS